MEGTICAYVYMALNKNKCFYSCLFKYMQYVKVDLTGTKSDFS